MKNKVTYIIFFFLLCLQHVHAFHEHYYFRNLSVEDGLAQTTVNAILQDKKGFMWFGTKDGLSRYDGLSFTNYKRNINDSCSLGNNFVTCLYEDMKGHIWIGTDAGLYIYYPEKEMFLPFSRLSREETKVERTVSAISADKNGRIWIAVETQGVFCYDPTSDSLRNYKLEQFSANVESIAFDNSNTMWIGFYGNGLFYSKDHLQTLTPYLSVNGGHESFKDDVVMKIIPGPYNCLYISSIFNGVQELNLTSGQLRSLLLTDETGDKLFCRDLLINADRELWMGTESGLFIYNLRSGKYKHLLSSSDNPYSLSDNAVYALCQDNEEGIWIGSYFGGLNYYPKSYTYFEKYYPREEKASLRGKRVREFCQDNDGILWIGTEDGGLNRFDPESKRFSFFESSTAFKNVHGLCMVDDYLWVGTFSKGLKIIDTHTGRIVKSYEKTSSPHSLLDNSVFSICRTATGDVYLGTQFGLLRYNKEVDGFDRIPELAGKFVYDILEDSRGDLWLATYAHGAFCFDVSEKQWKNYVHNEMDKSSLPYNKVLSVFEDAFHQIWLTTQGGGFCRFHIESETFTSYDTSCGLPNDVVYQIIEDDEGLFWLTTNKGLVSFNPSTLKMKVYTTANGLLGNQFNYRSSFKDRLGTLYLGSIDGFISFHPKSFVENTHFPSVVITDFMLFNKKVRVGESDSPLEKSISFSDSIVLKANQNSFSFRMAVLGYQLPKMNKLMYRLEGFDKNWNQCGENPVAVYTNLLHGDYVFRVKASNSDGVWGPDERVLHVRILPPFYLTGWAYCLYVLFLLSCSVYIVCYVRQRNRKLQLRQQEIFEQEKEREIYTAKIDFFTNVAHEIRTPLTLINGPLENIILNKKVDAETKEDLNVMKQNTERLLNLTNQLLDFRKTEKQGFKLNFENCNITEVLKETHLRFTSLAKQKGLDFILQIPEQDFYAHVNKEAFTKIISNLLNNGVKYADSYVHLTLEPIEKDGKPWFRICSENDGTVIPIAIREEIFQPFVRFNEQQDGKVTTGTGIGLALARSLAELHQGTLKMGDSESCNQFCLVLPVVQNMTISLMPAAEVDSETEEEKVAEISKKADNLPIVLVVEDNPEMLAFIVRQLSVDYTVLTAVNGSEALRVLDGHFVNLIISDVMMPVMDGFELCKTIKSNVDYSHIPVILLTAKTNIQSKIEGMELGADFYIEKPFSVKYLKACALNLIQNREKLRRAFAESPFVSANTIAMTKADEEFIQKLNEVVQANYVNPDFSMDDMAEHLNMSRSNFYRKIKGVLGLSPSEYLRLERLKIAAQLLKESGNRVSEICYMVGFSSPSYFAKCFQKQFGVLPKDFTNLK